METVTMFKCGETGRLFDSKQKAKSSERRFQAGVKREEKRKELQKKLEYYKDYIRLNAKYPGEIMPLVKEKALEFYGVALNFDPYYVKTSLSLVGCKETIRTGQFRISGKIVDTVKWNALMGLQDLDSSYGKVISSVFNFGFNGFGSGSGNPGSFGEYDFYMDISISIQDFPLVMENYAKFLKQKGLYQEEINHRERAARMAILVALRTREYREVEKRVLVFSKMRDDASRLKNLIVESHKDQFLAEWDKRNPSKVDKSLFSHFE